MNPALLIISFCTIVAINLGQQQLDKASLDSTEPDTVKVDNFKYTCTDQGIDYMLDDGLELETIKVICGKHQD